MKFRSASFFIFSGANTPSDESTILKNFDSFLTSYRQSGLNTVTLTWFNPVDVATGKIQQSYARGVPDYLNGLPSDSLLKQLTARAHAVGFDVTWKPHFITNDSKAGNVNPFFTGPGFDVTTFLSEVRAYWRSLSVVAEKANVELLILGTEHAEYATRHEAEWRQIIATVRSRFSGDVTYDELGYIGRNEAAADKIGFWDALDYIGVSMYLPLATDSTPTLAEAVAAIRANEIFFGNTGPRVDVPRVLSQLSEQFGKPVLFLEAGSQSRVGALQSPPFTQGAFSYTEQAILYAALMQEFSKYSWFQGINWWTNDHDFKAPPGTTGWNSFWFDLHKAEFSFLEKPAGDLVKAFWAAGMSSITLDGKIVIDTAANHALQGTPRNDIIVGANGDDSIVGDSGSDRLFGGDGADRVHSGSGADFVFGGSSFRDVADILLGEAGADTIFGGAGSDVIRGGAGNDSLLGGPGKDHLIGGDSNDIYVTSGGDTITENAHEGTDMVKSSASYTLGANLENLKLTGSAAINGSGNSLANMIIGNSGANSLNGSMGKDVLTGGGGADNFIFRTALGASNVDRITDFKVVGDTIRLENAVFAGLPTGILSAAAFVKNTSGNAADAIDRIIYETDTGKLFFDKDGTGAAARVHFATLDAGLGLTSADFLVF